MLWLKQFCSTGDWIVFNPRMCHGQEMDYTPIFCLLHDDSISTTQLSESEKPAKQISVLADYYLHFSIDNNI